MIMVKLYFIIIMIFMYFVECLIKLLLFKIRGIIVCNIKELCIVVSCCVEVGKLGRIFEVVLDIDFCN